MIHIGAKFRPFSHRIGARCLLPGTNLVVEIARHKVFLGILEIPLQCDLLETPFTLQQDLEKRRVKIFGKTFGLEIAASSKGIVYRKRGEKEVCLDLESSSVLSSVETLFLGSHKAQDVELLKGRFKLDELLPLLYRLSQLQCVPLKKQTSLWTQANLRDWIYQTFSDFLIAKPPVWEEAYSVIRSQFIQEENGSCVLLPNRLFPTGRFLHMQTDFGSIDFEWTQYTLRRAVLHVRTPTSLLFQGKGSCRVRSAPHEKGNRHDLSVPFFLQPGIFFLDRYENLDC